MLKRIGLFIRQHDWFAVGVEILVVMVGLMLALQLDRWRESVAERKQERNYVAQLITDFETDIPAIEYAVELQSLRLDLINLLMDIAQDPQLALDSQEVFVGAVSQAAYTYTPVLTSHTFDNLRSTGDMRLIRDESVKAAMFDYYGFDQSQRQYRPLQFQTEHRHFELAAGVLDANLERATQDDWLFFSPTNMDEVRSRQRELPGVLAAAKRLSERSELVAWLPYVRSMQLEQIDVHKMRLERAHVTRQALQVYADKIQVTYQ